MGKDNNSKPNSRSRRGRHPDSNNQPRVDCILYFKDPKPSNESIKAKFNESDSTEVLEQIRGYKTSENKANLVVLMNCIMNLGDLYKMWEGKKSKKLAQMMFRALHGQVRDDWPEFVGDCDD
jgi:hypothetical protein